MVLTEIEGRGSLSEIKELPAVLERECQEVADVYRAPNAFFLAYESEQLAGCVGVKLCEQDAEIARLYVRPSHRGQGIADQLMERAEVHARSSGARRVVLDVLPSRNDVIAWYERRGFSEIPAYERLPMAMVFLGKDMHP